MIEFKRPMSRHDGALRFSLIWATALACAATAEAAGWWSLKYPYRREVTIPQVERTGLSGDDVALVTMPTGGFGLPDGRDFRVTTSAGREVASRVLMVGPGDRVRIAFAVFPRSSRYHVYFGNADPGPRKKLDIRRGVLHEVWAHPGGPANEFSQVQDLLGKAKKLLGRNFGSGMFLGHNPFGQGTRVISVFTGYFVVKEPLTCEVACTARGSSFLHIDDKLVYSAVGRHRPERRIRRGGKVDLSPGLHKMTLHHVCPGGDLTTLVAWRKAGWEQFHIFPQNLFTDVTIATPGPMKRYGLAVDIDFIPVHAGEAFMKNRYFERYFFKALTTGKRLAKPTWRWDFGDGHSSSEAAVDHVYLKPGWYTISLTGKSPAGRLKRSNRIYVSRPWDRVVRGRMDSIKRYATIVEGYNLDALRPDLLAQAALLFQRAGNTDALLRAGTAFIKREKVEPQDVNTVVSLFTDALMSSSQPAAAVKALMRGAEMTTIAEVRIALLARAGRIRLGMGQTDEAMKLFEQVVGRYEKISSSQLLQEARFGVADAYRARGDYTKAKDAYGKIEIRRRSPALAVLHRGDLAMHVESYTREKDFAAAEDYLRQWQEAFPLDKLEGYWSLLRAKLSMARRRYAMAALEAELLTRVNPKSNYAPNLLMIAAEAYGKLKKNKQAQGTLRRIVEEYPESALAAQAAKKLERS